MFFHVLVSYNVVGILALFWWLYHVQIFNIEKLEMSLEIYTLAR